MIYVDSNVFLYAILNEKTDNMAKCSISILEKIIRKEINASTSFLTWDEVVWNIRKNLNNKMAIQEGRKFMEFPNLKFIHADQIVINEAQRLMETYEIKPRDAIHAASAVSCGIKEIISDDPDFDAVKEIKRVKIEKF